MMSLRNGFANKLKSLLIVVSAFVTVIAFQNCGQNGFQAADKLSKEVASSAMASSDDDMNMTEEPNFRDPEVIDESGNISIEDTPTAIAVVPTATVIGKSYYMSPSGKDTNSGTSLSAPWKTLDRLQVAVSGKIIKPGDVVWFRGGNYLVHDKTTRKYYTWNLQGTASAPITFRNYGSEKPYIVYDRRTFPSDASTSGWGVTLYLSGLHIIVDGINFRQTEESRRFAVINNDTYINRNAMARGLSIYGSNVIVRNCSIDNYSGLAIFQGESSNNLIVERCRITNVANHNLYLSGKNGIIRNNFLNGSRHTDGARTIQLQYKSSVGNKVYRNTIINGSADAVVFSGRLSYNEVFNNVIINGGSGRASGVAVGAHCEDGTPGVGNKFYNNTVIGKSISGLFSMSRCLTGLTKCDFHSVNDTMTRAECDAELARNRPTLGAIEIRDNIFNPIAGTKTGLSTALNISNIKNNIFYNATGHVPSGNKITNPLLENPSGTTAASAMIKSGSPAINTALISLLTFDFRGLKRPVGTKNDIGAYEFGAK